MPTGTIVVLEGITLNKASELLYGTELTLKERRLASWSYVYCLEKLAFGLICGGTIAAGRVTQLATGVDPFQDLRSDLKLNVEEVEEYIKQAPREPDLKDDPDERPIIKNLIESLSGAVRNDPTAWEEHARREIAGLAREQDLDSYLPGLKRELDDPSEYEFPPRWYQFWPDRELQQLVPPVYLDRVSSVITLPEPLRAMCDKALRAFLSRNVLAHLLIFHRYRVAVQRRFANEEPVLHLPYPTRASLPPPESDPLWRVQHCVARHLLLPILGECRERSKVRQWLQQCSLGPSEFFRRYRELLSEAVIHLHRGNEEDADHSAAALRELVGPGNILSLQIAQAQRDSTFPFGQLETLFEERYVELLERCFEELDLSGKRSRSGWTSGYLSIDRKLKEIEQEIREIPYIPETDRNNFIQLLYALGGAAAHALQRSAFLGKVSEAHFQAELLNLLDARLGEGVIEHAHIAGGITDLSFRGLIVELKVVDTGAVNRSSAATYHKQSREYIAGSVRHLGALCILDCSPKTSPSDHPENDIFMEKFTPTNGDAATHVAVVIMRGNLPTPSSLK